MRPLDILIVSIMPTEDHKKNTSDQPAPPRQHSFAYYVTVVYGIGLLFFLVIALLWTTAEVVLIVFAGILFAVLLNAATRTLMQHLGLPHGMALGIVLLLLITIFGLAGYFLAPRIATQIDQLVGTLPAAISELQSTIRNYRWGQEILQRLPDPQQIIDNTAQVFSQARSIFSGALGVIANFLIIFFVGIYLAAQPGLYIKGVLTLVPPSKRPRGRAVIQELGRTLELWLLGKGLSMILIGILSGVGLYLLGVPLAITLGVIAGLFDFIPYLGPILAGVPAVLIAFSESPMTALYVVLLFVGIQAMEGYLLAPIVERKTVSLPPALTISVQVMLGLAFGLLGVALASPLTAALFVFISMLYVQDRLGDDVRTPSEHP